MKFYSYVLLTMILSINISFAAPLTSYNLDKEIYRPGEKGITTIEIFNNEARYQWNFTICIRSVYITEKCGIIETLSENQRKSVSIEFQVSNNASSGAHDFVFNYSYQYGTTTASVQNVTKINIGALSLAEEADQAIRQIPLLIIEAEQLLEKLLQESEKARVAVEEAEKVTVQVGTAKSYYTASTNAIQTASAQIDSVKARYSSAQSYYSQQIFDKSFSEAFAALSEIRAAKQNIENGIESAQKAYVLAGGQEEIEKIEQIRTTTSITAPKEQQDYNFLLFIIVVIVFAAIYFYPKKGKK